jgi:hypothetical protein
MNSVVSYQVDGSTGKLTQKDWFCPTNYDHLNGADRDVGSSGVALLDPGTFSGGGVNRIAIAAGKNGTVRRLCKSKRRTYADSLDLYHGCR